MQGTSEHADIENGLLDTVREGKSGMNEESSINIYTMEYYVAIKRNSFESVLMRWMKLEPIIQSEVVS